MNDWKFKSYMDENYLKSPNIHSATRPQVRTYLSGF